MDSIKKYIVNPIIAKHTVKCDMNNYQWPKRPEYIYNKDNDEYEESINTDNWVKQEIDIIKQCDENIKKYDAEIKQLDEDMKRCNTKIKLSEEEIKIANTFVVISGTIGMCYALIFFFGRKGKVNVGKGKLR
jgi:peptidoglycan hydrolase CwlO-like protein